MSFKILQFDDDELMTKMYSLKFKKPEFEYVWAEHPPTNKSEDLINYVLDIKPDLIIMDIIMPIMDGFKATEILKNDDRTKNIPIVALTNMSGEEDIKTGMDLGMTDYWINVNNIPSKIVSMVNNLLKNK